MPYMVFLLLKAGFMSVLLVNDCIDWGNGVIGNLILATSIYWIAFDVYIMIYMVAARRITAPSTRLQAQAVTMALHDRLPPKARTGSTSEPSY